MPTISHLAGLPLARWTFVFRIWLAIHLALGVAFWLELEGASSAGVTVAILALQTRGQILEKALYRVAGTIAGSIMAVIIVGLFAQTRDLYIIAYSLWLAVCIFAAGFLAGNRAYGAVLCGYTFAIVAVMNVDDPGNLFSAITNRGAAIAIGIASITLVMDLLGGPEIGPRLLETIEREKAKVRAWSTGLLSRIPPANPIEQMAGLLRSASDHHLLLSALPVESLSGSARAGAFRATLAGLVGEARAARALAAFRSAPPRTGDQRLADAVGQRLAHELQARRAAATTALAAARAGRPIAPAPRMPIYRSWESALQNSLRGFLACAVSGILFALAGLPAAAFAWGMIGIVMCLSSNAPDPTLLGKAALVVIPAAIALGGITKFLILDGVDAFPLLMIGTAPALFFTLLLTSSPRPELAAIGPLATLYTIVILGPSNPQSYDPQDFVLVALLLLICAFLAFIFLTVFFPANDGLRRRWVLASARRDLDAALNGRTPTLTDDENRLLDASRIGALVGLKAGAADPAAELAAVLRMADLAGAARSALHGLGDLAARDTRVGYLVRDSDVRSAIATTDAPALRRLAGAFLDTGDDMAARLAADLAWMAELIDGTGKIQPFERS